MPIEFERKYIIPPSTAVEKDIAEHAEQILHIEQKYLSIEKGFSVRVRSIDSSSYFMTVKKDIGGQCIEIECPISEEDFTKLWPTACNLVTKIRYLFRGWDIDFFKQPNGENYFAVAEIEMLPWMKAPSEIPELLAHYIIYTVPLGDGRFSNKKLGNIKYAVELLQNVRTPFAEQHLKLFSKKVK